MNLTEKSTPRPAKVALATEDAVTLRQEQQDRKLQQDIADYTGVMALTGIAGLLLSALGIALVWRTFQATRRQVSVAQENLDAFYESERAIVHAVDADVGKIDGVDFLALQVKNKGRSAGRVLLISGGPSDTEGPNEAARWAIVPPGETVFVPVFPMPAKDIILSARCQVHYRSVGPKVYRSHFKLDVKWVDARSGNGILPRWQIDVANRDGHPDDI